MDGYYTIKNECCGEITEKKSRFIATVRPVKSEDEALNFIQEMKKKYWDARHNCSAYIIAETIAGNGEEKKVKITEKANDDGEPSKTAGSPILEVIKGEGLKNCAVVVTRYFGGVLLGTGGLVRAYQAAVKAGLENSRIIEKREGIRASLTADYTIVGKLQYIFDKNKYTVLGSKYEESVTFTLLIPSEDWDSAQSAVTEATAGQCEILKEDECIYGIVDKEAVVF